MAARVVAPLTPRVDEKLPVVALTDPPERFVAVVAVVADVAFPEKLDALTAPEKAPVVPETPPAKVPEAAVSPPRIDSAPPSVMSKMLALKAEFVMSRSPVGDTRKYLFELVAPPERLLINH
jgi:hypothetical protein